MCCRGREKSDKQLIGIKRDVIEERGLDLGGLAQGRMILAGEYQVHRGELWEPPGGQWIYLSGSQKHPQHLGQYLAESTCSVFKGRRMKVLEHECGSLQVTVSVRGKSPLKEC